MNSDVRVIEARPYFSLEKPRFPLKFGAVVMTETTYCQVRVKVENRKGEIASGYGGMFLSDVWAFPTFAIPHDKKDQAMKKVTERFCSLVENYKEFAHPVKIFLDLEKELEKMAKEITGEFSFPEELPLLACLVSVSPVDGALHDAFGQVNRISTYDGYGKDFMDSDLSLWLGEEFKGKYIGDYLKKEYSRTIPVFHLVGGLDKLRESEVEEKDPRDGFPNSLEKWIAEDGLFCLKVKLKGTDLEWDLDRFLSVAGIAHRVSPRKTFYFSADTNEQCETPDYIVEFLDKVKKKDAKAFAELLYIEQPTERELRCHKFNMTELAKIKPVIIDESLISIEDYELAKELGWSGIALKVCKSQSASLLFVARASEDKIPYAVQDLTNPGIALIQSAGFAGRINTLKGVEANSHQFFPRTNLPESKVHPGIFKRTDGCLNLQTLKGYGLGYQMERIERKWD